MGSRIELTTNIKNNDNGKAESNVGYQRVPLLGQLNFRHKDIDWIQLNREIDDIHWEALFDGKDAVECTEIFMGLMELVCKDIIPKRRTCSKSGIPRERKRLLNRLKMLKRQKHIVHGKCKRKEIEKKILETEMKITEHWRNERKLKEKKVLEDMDKDPKISYDYIKEQNKSDNAVGPFKKKKKKYLRCSGDMSSTGRTIQLRVQPSN